MLCYRICARNSELQSSRVKMKKKLSMSSLLNKTSRLNGFSGFSPSARKAAPKSLKALPLNGLLCSTFWMTQSANSSDELQTKIQSMELEMHAKDAQLRDLADKLHIMEAQANEESSKRVSCEQVCWQYR